MNFLKTLGGLVGSSATGGLPYVIDTPGMDGNVAADGAAGDSVVFEGLPDFVLHSGKSKQDPCHSVSLFKSRQPATQLTLNALRRIKTLRHPNILAYQDGVEVPNNGPVIIVTEHVMPLSEFLTALRMEYGAQSEEFAMCVSWGLRSVLMALQFINVDCKLIHGRLTPQSIFVTKGGDWKLGGFELTAEITSDGPSYIYTAFQQYTDVNYKSPECQRSNWKAVATGPPYGVDMWAFACLMFYVFNDGQFRSSDISTGANIPPAIRTQFRKATDANAARRPSPQKMLGCSYFDTPFIKRMQVLENLAVKSSDEKAAFYKELCANIETLPRCFGVHKILPALKQIVEFGSMTGAKNGPVKLDPSASHMLPAMVQIGGSLSAEEFKAEVLPIIIKLFSCNDRAVRVQLLQMMEKFTVHFDAKLVNSTVVFDNLCSGFTDAAPVLRELTVKSMLHIADKLSDSNLNNRVMKYFARLQSDPEPAIRTNTTICLGKIASKLNDTTRPKVLFPAFAKALKDPFPHARLAGLRSMTACQEYFTPQGVASSIVPAISPLLLDVSVTVRDQAKISMDKFMKTVLDEADRMKVGEELEARQRELRHALGDVDDAGANGAILPSSSGGHSTTGYASSLTAWASSAVASNVNKLVGIGALSSAMPALDASAAASSSHSTSFPSTKIETDGASSLTMPSSKHNSSNTFPAKDGWNDDDDLDGLDSPKRSNAGFSTPLSVNRGARSSNASAAESSLSKSMSSSTSSVKLSVSCKPATNLTSSMSGKTTTSTFAMDAADNEWADDNWGADDDLGFDASAPKAHRLSVGSQKGASRLSTSSLLTSTTSISSTSAGSSIKEKTTSDHRAEAHVKSKAKREPLGAMKLNSTASEKADNWNWDF
uniref:Protein kinase domain-containing protein n=1 Tax=Peronospora matthiolae TaxID=2874970 RepID=A0AAV1U2E3_9STRA